MMHRPRSRGRGLWRDALDSIEPRIDDRKRVLGKCMDVHQCLQISMMQTVQEGDLRE